MLYDVLFWQRLHNIVKLEHAHKIHLLGARGLGHINIHRVALKILRAFAQPVQHTSQHHATIFTKFTWNLCSLFTVGCRPLSTNAPVKQTNPKIERRDFILVSFYWFLYVRFGASGVFHLQDSEEPTSDTKAKYANLAAELKSRIPGDEFEVS